MDRRTFLRSSAALAVASAAGELNAVAQPAPSQAEHPMAPPVANQAAPGDLKPFTWEAAGLVFAFEFAGDRLRFRNVLPQGGTAIDGLPAPAEMSGLETSLHCTGEDVPDHHGAKFCGAYPGCRMVFAGKHEERTPRGKQLVLSHRDEITGLRIESIYSTTNDIAVARRFTRIRNGGKRPVGIEYVSSAMLNNFAAPSSFQHDLVLHFAFNSWQAEAQWHSVPLADAGLVQNGNFSVSGASFTSVGSWPSQRYLPMAMLENKRAGVTWFWQVEHNGSWHCEIAQTGTRSLYAWLGGPDAQHAQAWKQLNPGEEYETVPVAVGCVRGGFEQAIAELTRYRRANQLHPRSDTRDCPVVFNDVIALQGDQSTAREIPLIDAAAAAGCEIYCMDVGWCTRPGENWWNPVGDWVADAERFPGGLRGVTDYIRGKGMVPGLWIEPEVAGLWTSIAKRPDSWFFMRHGRRIIDHTRYQLDYRNPDVRAYIDRVFERLVREYGIGYIKLDYNINALEGTETAAESFGQGLLGHNRAFLSWLDALLDRYPDLTLETVASGGMRM
ncbi:MAG TPA: alpha-galactosidase, partial [Terracidiphilus sp.]|nr:alpha-galactosidase [Terracidiphilus sp.]